MLSRKVASLASLSPNSFPATAECLLTQCGVKVYEVSCPGGEFSRRCFVTVTELVVEIVGAMSEQYYIRILYIIKVICSNY